MSILDDVEKITTERIGQDANIIKRFLDSTERFNELVRQGITEPRSNQIMPLDDQYRKKIRFNVANIKQ